MLLLKLRIYVIHYGVYIHKVLLKIKLLKIKVLETLNFCNIEYEYYFFPLLW